MAGLGCPNGCDFCCTSHFFSRKHIRLLPEGKDIYAVAERYLDLDPELVLLIIDEDFLLNKKRAMEFRDCVMKGGKTLSIFAFSSVKAISQYTVEEILEMGIDGFWIGYEGTRSGYAKQQGRPIEDILTEFREHGITILTSMIVGFDYQTPEVVAQELDGLMKLKPALAQFLIYGPVPGTPFYERAIKDNLLQDDVHQGHRPFLPAGRRVRHDDQAPDAVTRSESRICNAGVSKRISSGLARASSARWKGDCSATKSSSNLAESRACARRPSFTPKSCGPPTRRFSPAGCSAPTAAIRRWIGQLERSIHAELGAPTLRERLESVLAVGAAALDRPDAEAEPVSASQADADDLSDAGQALGWVRAVGGTPSQSHDSQALDPG